VSSLVSFFSSRVLVKRSNAKAQDAWDAILNPLLRRLLLLKQLIARNSDAVPFTDPEAGSASCGPGWIHLWFCPRKITSMHSRSIWSNWEKEKKKWLNSPIFSHDLHLV